MPRYEAGWIVGMPAETHLANREVRGGECFMM